MAPSGLFASAHACALPLHISPAQLHFLASAFLGGGSTLHGLHETTGAFAHLPLSSSPCHCWHPPTPPFPTQDLEYLISKAVNPKQADYAVVTGVQIHNWASDLDDVKIPSMEFIAPARAYVVVNQEKIDIDLQQVPALSPRQLQLLAAQSTQHVETSKHLTTGTPNSMLQEIPRDYLLNRLGGVNTSIHLDVEHQGPSWREYIKTTYHDAHHNAPKMDEHVSSRNLRNI